MSPLPVVGRRTDTQCEKCLLVGHDTRNHTCPYLKLQMAIIEHSAELFESQEQILTIAASYNWQFSLPPLVRFRRESIIELWALLKAERDQFVTKTGAWAPKRSKGSKRKASTPQPVVAPKKRRPIAKAVPKGKQAVVVVDSDDDAQTAAGTDAGEVAVAVENTSPAVHLDPNVHGNGTFSMPQAAYGVDPSAQLSYGSGWNANYNMGYQNRNPYQPMFGYYNYPQHDIQVGYLSSTQHMETRAPAYHISGGGQPTRLVYSQPHHGMGNMNPHMPLPTAGQPSNLIHCTQPQNGIVNSLPYPPPSQGYPHESADMFRDSHASPSAATPSGNFTPVDNRTGPMASTSAMNMGAGTPLSSGGMANLKMGAGNVPPPFRGQMEHSQAPLGHGYGSVAQHQQNHFQYAHVQQPQNGGHVYGSQSQLQNPIYAPQQAQNGGQVHGSVSQPQQNHVHVQQPQKAGPIPMIDVPETMAEPQTSVQKKASKPAPAPKSKPAARGKSSAPKKAKKPRPPPPPPPPIPGPGVPWTPDQKFVWLRYAFMPQTVMRVLLPHAANDDDHSQIGMKFRTADLDEELKTTMKPFVVLFTAT